LREAEAPGGVVVGGGMKVGGEAGEGTGPHPSTISVIIRIRPRRRRAARDLTIRWYLAFGSWVSE
jgi:hypothetical protein